MWYASTTQFPHYISSKIIQKRKPSDPNTAVPLGLDAVITVTIHNRLSWSHGYLSRASQHALLASQTLGDLFRAVLCVSNEFPQDDPEVDSASTSTQDQPRTSSAGGLICIEGQAYSSQSEPCYAESVISSFIPKIFLDCVQ